MRFASTPLCFVGAFLLLNSCPVSSQGVLPAIPPQNAQFGYNSFQVAQDQEVAQLQQALAKASKSNQSWISNIQSKGLVKWAADLLGADSLIGPAVSRDTSLTGDSSSTTASVTTQDALGPSAPGEGSISSVPSRTPTTPTTTTTGSESATDSSTTKAKSCKTGLTTCNECVEVSGCFWCSVGGSDTTSTSSSSTSSSKESQRLKRSLLDLPTGTCTAKDLSDQTGHLNCVTKCTSGAWSSKNLMEMGALFVAAIVMRI